MRVLYLLAICCTSREFVISQLVAGLNIPLILSTQERMRQRIRPTITIDVNQPTYSEQRDIWEFHLGSVALELNGHIDKTSCKSRRWGKMRSEIRRSLAGIHKFTLSLP